MHSKPSLPPLLFLALSVAVPVAQAMAAAAPGPNPTPRHSHALAPRADPAAPWITVNGDGQPEKTLTPTPTLVDGTTSWVDGAPEQLTGTVFTFTNYGKLTTSTVTDNPPPPTADSKTGQGGFLPCLNSAGLFCEPNDGDTLNPGNTYYVTWDPEADVLAAIANTTLQLTLRGDFVNATTGNTTTAFESSSAAPLEWGFLPWTVEPSLLGDYPDGVNISLQLRQNRPASLQKTPVEVRRTVAVQWPPAIVPPETKMPRSNDLLIALPLVGVFIVACVVGPWWWNRHQRHIGLGNVMSRTRFGHGLGRMGVAKQARQRRMRAAFAAATEDARDIPLSERNGGGFPATSRGEFLYRDDDKEWDVTPRADGGSNKNP